MITSERQYKDLTVIRETMIACGPDVLKTGHGEEIHTVRVERRCGANEVFAGAHIEIIMPSEPLFREAVEATMESPASEFARKGGSAKSPRKAASSAENGKKGGRPRKTKD